MGSQFIYEMKDIFLHILITWSINWAMQEDMKQRAMTFHNIIFISDMHFVISLPDWHIHH